MVIRTSPGSGLALAQIGQEELGKSLSLLAAVDLKPRPEGWDWFWRGWRNHKLKAHRAYLYELLDPQRIEMKAPDGRVLDGGPLRDSITAEKESGLYVDFDETKGEFTSPIESVQAYEAHSRLATLGYLGVTASVLHDVLSAKDSLDRATAFSEIAFRICTESLYQQDMPSILDQFAARSAKRRELVDDLRQGFSQNRMRAHRAGKSVDSQVGKPGTK